MTTTPTANVIHVSDMKQHPDALYIGRSMPRQRLKASPLGNPYKIGTHGDRAEVLRLYAIYLRSEVRRGDPAFIAALLEARHRPLACWCRKAGEARHIEVNGCHGDIIRRYLDQHTDEQIRAWEQAEMPATHATTAHTATNAGEAREMTYTDGGRPSGEINGQVGEG